MILPYLTQPSEPMWIMGRVATLLLPYYERETPQAVREMEAEDWADALREFPAWAITAAVRWWKGADNPKRHKRPMEGDIAARCHIEMDAVNAAKRLMAEPIWPTHRIPVRPEPPEPKVKAEDVAEILASLNAKVADNQMNKSRDQA